jgi:transketolase
MHETTPSPEQIRDARLRLLQMHYESGVGHIGGNLSSLDIMMCLYHGVMAPDDAFVLSKGHAAGALYATLWSLGLLDGDDLKTFHKDGTRLSGHPPAKGIPEILFATGSLGHGLSLAGGLALGKRLKGEPGRVFCLLSDGEWNEGSTWEALIFACHQRLDNLTLIIDLNGLQGFGTTTEVAMLAPLAEKLRTFGLTTTEIDGHNRREIHQALLGPVTDDGRWTMDDESMGTGSRTHFVHRQSSIVSCPHAVVARTRKGHGVSFMEDRMEWHYLPMTEEQYTQAVQEVKDACATSSAAV